MDLETYRSDSGLTYSQLAKRIRVGYARQAQRYAIGEQWPGPEQLQNILDACDGVTIEAMHEQRLRVVRNRKESDQAGTDADAIAI